MLVTNINYRQDAHNDAEVDIRARVTTAELEQLLRSVVCGGRYREIDLTNIPKIKEVIYNKPATIVLWADGTKTVVKCQYGDTFDRELGLAMACTKKLFGNTGNYNEIFKKYAYEEEPLYRAVDRAVKGLNKFCESVVRTFSNGLSSVTCYNCKHSSTHIDDKPCVDCVAFDKYEEAEHE